MFKWIRNWRGQRNFNRAWRAASEQMYDQGKINRQEYLACIEAADNPEALKLARNQLRADPNMLGGVSDWNWEAIKQWFIDYFIPAMKIIIPIVLMLLQPNPMDDDE